MKRTRGFVVAVAAILGIALAGLTYVLVDAQDRSRQQLERVFYQRPAIAAALFDSLLQGTISSSSVPSNLTRARISAADVRRDGDAAGQRLAVYGAYGQRLAARQVSPTAPIPSPGAEREVVAQARAAGTAISDVVGSPPNASLEFATGYKTAFGERVQVTEFPLQQISSLLPAYMTTMAELGGEAFILDGTNHTIGSNVPSLAAGRLAPDPALLVAQRAHHRGGYARAGHPWHFASGGIPGTHWHIVLSVPDANLYAAVSGAGQSASWVLLALFALCGAAVLALVARAGRDSRRLARAYGDLELRNTEIEEANKAKSTFLAGMSHELRTPLNGIIGFAELMHDGKVGEVSDQHREYLGDILTSAQHLLTLINDILDISKVEAGKLEFRPEPVALEPLVCEIKTALRPLAEEKQIAVTGDVDPRLGTVWLDPAKFRQVLFNYVSNAIKFTAGPGRVSIRLRPGEAGMLCLEVEDTGSGIAAEDMGKLFSEFGQLKRGGGAMAGTGLGLALTKRIVEAQGGTVGAHSELGRGSVFLATIPCRRPAGGIEAPHNARLPEAPAAVVAG